MFASIRKLFSRKQDPVLLTPRPRSELMEKFDRDMAARLERSRAHDRAMARARAQTRASFTPPPTPRPTEAPRRHDDGIESGFGFIGNSHPSWPTPPTVTEAAPVFRSGGGGDYGGGGASASWSSSDSSCSSGSDSSSSCSSD